MAYCTGPLKYAYRFGSNYHGSIGKKRKRGAHFREDYPEKDAESGKFNLVIKKNADGQMTGQAGTDSGNAGRSKTNILREMK